MPNELGRLAKPKSFEAPSL